MSPSNNAARAGPKTPDRNDYAAFPRPQRGSQPQLLLLTILANYWLYGPTPVPSAALIEMLEDLGVTQAGGRTTLSRMGKRNLLTSTRQGRRSFYQLADGPAWVLANRTVELLRFGSETETWDGQWTCVAFSVPNERRHLRPQLRTRLRELGFAGLYDGLWVSPRPQGQTLEQALAELDEVGSATVLRATIDPQSGRHQPIEAFDLAEVADAYAEFIDEFEPIQAANRQGKIAPTEALAARTRATNSWRRLNRLDPELPRLLLPDDWPRPRARELFVALYDTLAEPAARRFDEVVSRHEPTLAGQLRYFTTTNRPDLGSLQPPLSGSGQTA